jgi:hypothetical protein
MSQKKKREKRIKGEERTKTKNKTIRLVYSISRQGETILSISVRVDGPPWEVQMEGIDPPYSTPARNKPKLGLAYRPEFGVLDLREADSLKPFIHPSNFRPGCEAHP